MDPHPTTAQLSVVTCKMESANWPKFSNNEKKKAFLTKMILQIFQKREGVPPIH